MLVQSCHQVASVTLTKSPSLGLSFLMCKDGIITSALALLQDCSEDQLWPVTTSPIAHPQLTPQVHKAYRCSHWKQRLTWIILHLLIPKLHFLFYAQLVPHVLLPCSHIREALADYPNETDDSCPQLTLHLHPPCFRFLHRTYFFSIWHTDLFVCLSTTRLSASWKQDFCLCCSLPGIPEA